MKTIVTIIQNKLRSSEGHFELSLFELFMHNSCLESKGKGFNEKKEKYDTDYLCDFKHGDC